MASGTVMTHLAYLNNLAQNSRAPAVYTGNNPYNAQYEKPESETDKQLAQLKMKTEMARANSLKSGSALDQQRFAMQKSKNDLDLKIRKQTLQTQEDLANNIGVVGNPNVTLTEDTTEMKDTNVMAMSEANTKVLIDDIDKERKKQGIKPLTDFEKETLKRDAEIINDSDLSPTEKRLKRIQLSKDRGMVKVDKNGNLEDTSGIISGIDNGITWGAENIIQPISDFFTDFGLNEEQEAERDLRNEAQYKAAYGKSEKDQFDIYKDKIRGLTGRKNSNEQKRKALDQYILKRNKELTKSVKTKVKIEHKGVIRSKTDVRTDLNNWQSTELKKIRAMGITPAAKVTLSQDVLAKRATIEADYAAKVEAKAKEIAEIRKIKAERETNYQKSMAKMEADIAVARAKENTAKNKAEVAKLIAEKDKLEREAKTGWFS